MPQAMRWALIVGGLRSLILTATLLLVDAEARPRRARSSTVA